VVTDSWWGTELLTTGSADTTWATAVGDATYGTLRAEVARLAAVLRHHGIGPGHAVALDGAASFTQLWALLALWSIGAQVLHLDPRIRGAQRADLFTLCAPQFHIVIGPGRYRPDLVVDECEVLVRRLHGGRPAGREDCLVQFTSGTMGRIRPVGRTPESLLSEVYRLCTLPGMPRGGESVLVLDSLTHSFGLIGGVLHALAVGATLVFVAPARTSGITGAARSANVILGSPKHFALLGETHENLSLPALRTAVSSGEILPQPVYDNFAARYGVLIGQAYGTTETGVVATDLDGTHGPRTIGRPAPGVRTRITSGVLQVHMARSANPYESGNGGWLSTRDLVTCDPESGTLQLRGRIDQDGLAASADVDLAEIENVLRAHPGVSDVVVLGGESVDAHVVGSVELGEADLTAWCRRFLDETNTPSRYHLMRDLPLTANGKRLRSRRHLSEHRLTPATVGESA
jgi:acyl-coenzyme A synthetase/AMP-(fatty) acid ligase